MTNYKWLVENYPDLVSKIIAGRSNALYSISGIGLQLDGTPCLCKDLSCNNCRFHVKTRIEDSTDCTSMVLKWLKEEHIEYTNVSNIKELKEAFYKFKETNSTHNVFTVVDIEYFLDHIVITGGGKNDKS